MSDDIDIEEHDLLDNPLLKNIFPDLSVLKEEIDEHLNQASTETFYSTFTTTKNNTSLEHLDLKQTYDYQNKQNVTLLGKRDVLKPIPSSKLDNKQIIYGNKIILGSKPPKIQHKKNFEAQVKLIISNIGPYLQKSEKYCKECLILYPNKLKLEAHMKSTHSEKVVRSYIKIKKKPKLKILPKCNICHTFFSSRGDLEKHFQTKHKKDMKTCLKKNVKADGTDSLLNEKSTNPKHSCSHCQKLFPNVSDLIGHMYEIFKLKKSKITFKKGLDKSLQPVLNQPVLNQQEIKAYQCPFCSYYFITTKNYFCHIQKKHNMSHITDVKKVPVKLHCKDCSLDFRNIKAYNNHISKNHLQPIDPKVNNIKEILNVENEKKSSEAIITVTPEVQLEKSYAFKSVLFKCSLCDVHFLSANTAINHLHHLEILIHWKCNICQKIFKKNDEVCHKTQHTYSDEFNVFHLDSATALKVLFKCFQCAIHFTEEYYVLHSPLCGTTQCISVYCTVCDILVDKTIMENHKYSHDYKKYQKDGYIVIDAECIIAKNNISENVQSGATTIPIKDLQSQSKNIMAKDSGCTMPNVLFLCKNCNYAVDDYDKTIHHCQEHCQSNNDIISLECNICYYHFSLDDHAKHQKLHEKNQWNASLLKVFTYDNAYFLSENAIWTQHLFGPLSNNEMIKEFIQTSIYRYEHRIKLHILQDGPIELTVYKCEKCCRFIDPISLFKHLDSCSLHLRRHPCPICGLPFISTTSQKNHRKIHETSEVGLKSYKIVSFNNTVDAIFNKNIIASYNQHLLFQCRMCNVAVNKGEVEKHKVKCTNCDIKKCDICGLLIYQSYYESHISKHKDLNTFNENNIKIILFGKRIDKGCKSVNGELQPSFRGVIIDYTFYKCSKCAICVRGVQSTLEHSCSLSVSRAKCPKCPIYLYTNKLHEHIKMHEREIEFRQDNINIIKFDIEKQCDEILNQDPKLKMSPIVVIKRERNQIFNKKYSLKNSSTQSEKFSFLNPKNGGDIRNTIERNKREDIIVKEIEIFKCFCGLHFLDENSANKHAANCNSKSKICKQTCSKCNLLFTPNELFTHVLDHHGNKLISYKYNVIDIIVKDDLP